MLETQEMQVQSLGRSPREGNGKPTPVFFPGKFHGQRSVVGYSPWAHKESDVTEHAHAHTRAHTHTLTVNLESFLIGLLKIFMLFLR